VGIAYTLGGVALGM